MRVAFLSRGLTNPLALIWPEALVEAGHSVGHIDFGLGAGGHGSDGSVDLSAVTLAPPGPLDRHHAAEAEDMMGGRPDVTFAWWGSGSIHYGLWARHAWPGAPIVLCLDTFPNASMLATEAREVLRLRRLISNVGGLVYFSQPMKDLFELRVPHARSLPSIKMPQPLTSRVRAREGASLAAPHRLPDRSGGEGPRILFTGRPDYLFSSDRRMGKDALGPTLEGMVNAGASVYVPSFRRETAPRGMHSYPVFSTAQMLDGTFATYVAQFDAQVALYQPVNRTIRRRLATSLSTRFGLAFAAPTTVIVRPESTFAVDLLTDLDLGVVLRAPNDLVASLDAARKARTVEAWHRHRDLFSASALASEIEGFFRTVAGR